MLLEKFIYIRLFYFLYGFIYNEFYFKLTHSFLVIFKYILYIFTVILIFFKILLKREKKLINNCIMLYIMQRDINFIIFMNYFLFEKKNYLKRVTRVKKETFLSKSIYKLYIIRNILSRKQIL